MKSILSAAALLAVIAAPAFAQKAPSQEEAPPVIEEIVPTSTAPASDPAMSEIPAVSEDEMQSKASMGGHGCGGRKNTVYLTN